MGRTEGVDDAVWFVFYARQAADPFPSVTELANALPFVRAVERRREEIPWETSALSQTIHNECRNLDLQTVYGGHGSLSGGNLIRKSG